MGKSNIGQNSFLSAKLISVDSATGTVLGHATDCLHPTPATSGSRAGSRTPLNQEQVTKASTGFCLICQCQACCGVIQHLVESEGLVHKPELIDRTTRLAQALGADLCTGWTDLSCCASVLVLEWAWRTSTLLPRLCGPLWLWDSGATQVSTSLECQGTV